MRFCNRWTVSTILSASRFRYTLVKCPRALVLSSGECATSQPGRPKGVIMKCFEYGRNSDSLGTCSDGANHEKNSTTNGFNFAAPAVARHRDRGIDFALGASLALCRQYSRTESSGTVGRVGGDL